jgi:hypothetical protein
MTRLRRGEDLSVTEMDGDLFLVRGETGEIWHLDAMAAGLWNALDRPATRDGLLQLFADAFPDVAEETLRADLDRAIRDLSGAGLILETGPD